MDVARYLSDRARSLSPYTLQRRLVAIARAHHSLNVDSPCSHRLVRATMGGIRRLKGMRQRRVRPLLSDDLRMILEVIPDDLRGLRDKTLLLVGFAGAFRRSELAEMRVESVSFVAEGMILDLLWAKTDQENWDEGSLFLTPDQPIVR